MLKKAKTRYSQIKKLTIDDMAGFLSWYVGCDRCPAKKEGCQEDCSFCVDALKEWLQQEGQL